MTDKILRTSNYGLFVLSPFNRDVEVTRDLEVSMRAYGFVDVWPLFVTKRVDGKLEIKDGHHRFVVARMLKIEVIYRIVTGKAAGMTVHEITSTHRPHSVKDFLTCNIRSGHRDSLVVLDYHKRTGIPMGVCLSLLGGYTSADKRLMDRFKIGTFKVGDLTVAKFVEEVVAHAMSLNLPFASNVYFVRSVARMAFVKECSLKMLKDRMKANQGMLATMGGGLTIVQYARLLEQVYNKGNRNKVGLELLAQKAANERFRASRFQGEKEPKPSKAAKPREEKASYGEDRENPDKAVHGAGKPGNGAHSAPECHIGA